MPGIIVFQRRWSVGSDDLFVPASFLVVFHLIWLIVLGISLDGCSEVEPSISTSFLLDDKSNIPRVVALRNETLRNVGNVSSQIIFSEESNPCKIDIFRLHVAFLMLWSIALLIEVAIICVSLRGAILEAHQRWPAEYLLYVKLALWLLEIVLTAFCATWTSKNYISCPISRTTKSVMIGLVISNSVIFLTALMTIWCSFDVAGRYWVQLKKYQNSKNSKSKSVRSDGGSELFSKQSALVMSMSLNTSNQDVPPLFLQQNPTEKNVHSKGLRGNPNRSWKHRKVRLAYQNSWDARCHHLFCCVRISKNRKAENSFSDIARVLSEFFRDLDVVPGDVVVGLVLLRQRQQLLRLHVVHQPTNSVYKFLSGVRVTPNTPFLLASSSTYHNQQKETSSIASQTHNMQKQPHSNSENNLCPDKDNDTQTVSDAYRFMHFAMGIYGWPMYLRQNTGMATCRLCSSLSCCKVGHNSSSISELDNGTYPTVNDDNCCSCNYAAYSQIIRQIDPGNIKLIYATYHVDVGETPFLIVVDYSMRAVVVSIRGTLSLKDILTDLNAEGEPLPIRPVNEEWMGHKGMVDAAQYIYKKLKEEHLLTRAFNSDTERGTQNFDLVCVGHSLGAGTATILSIMLRQELPRTRCFAYSPPGGTLSQSAVEYSKEFVTSVVVGKDVVPRIGLHQMETLRHDLINALQKSRDPKWKTLLSSMACCGVTSVHELTAEEVEKKLGIDKAKDKKNSTLITLPHKNDSLTKVEGQPKGEKEKTPDNEAVEVKVCKSQADEINIHPLDATIHLSVHQKLLPPGKIIHIVRHYQRNPSEKKSEPTYKAIWAENTSFDEVLISKKMVQDHMPDTVLEVLGKLMQQMKESSNHSAEQNTQNSNYNERNPNDQCTQKETLKGTFVTTTSKNEDTLINVGVNGDEAHLIASSAQSTEATQL